jgi:cobalt-zinc-cadmium efflux system outer membrane protein
MLGRFFAVGSRLLWLGLLAGAQRPAFAGEPLDEREATRRVCAEGPGASIARAQRLRGNAETTAAGVLPNPSFVAEHQRSLSGPTEHETIVGLSVPLGIGGARFLLQGAARERRRQAHAEAEDTLFESALAFREAYVRAAAEHTRASLLSERQASLEGLTKTIEALARSGEAAGYDLLRQQAQMRRHQATLESVRARARALHAVVESWAGAAVVLRASGRAPLEPELRSAGEAGTRGTPSARVRGLEAGARASALESRAAGRKWLPDLEVFAGYRQLTTGPDTGHGLSLGLSVPVTLFDYGQGEAARADAERELALGMAARLRRERRAELEAARILIAGLGAALERAADASARAAEVERKARKLYAAGEATITELLGAFHEAEEAELAKLALEEEVQTTRVHLMRALGSMLDPSLDRACKESTGRAR